MPPTSIDGSDITGATIDGQDVSEITVDGNVVFEAGPDIPDVSMFQDPIHQYLASENYATSTGDWTDTISNITATENGSPSKTSVDGRDAIYYQSGDDHTYSDSTLTGSGEFSMFAVLRADSSQTGYAFGIDSVGAGPNNGVYHINSYNGLGGPGGGSFPSDTWTSMGFTRSSGGTYNVYGGGSSSSLDSENGPNVATDFGIGTRPGDDNDGLVVYVNEIVVTNAEESGTAYQQWHNDRFA